MIWPSQNTLETRYARPNSQFLTVGGTRMHFTDQGSGPVVVLLSAHWASFTMWDGWLPHLAAKYRVLAVDLPGHGLTGPADDYSIEGYTRLLIGLLDQIGIDRFTLVGTSFSGVIAFRYAAMPENRLEALILANASGMPRQPGSGPSPNQPPPQWLYRLALPHFAPRGFMRWKLGTLLLDHSRITPERVREFADFNSRRGRIDEAERRTRAYQAGDPQSVLANVRVPVLIQWSTHSAYLKAHEADLFQAFLTNAPTEKIVYPGVGHLIVLDAPEATGRDARAFLDRVLT